MSDPAAKTRVHIETTFVAIPSEVAADADLSPGAKLLFGCIYSLSMSPARCVQSNESLARRISMSVKQVKRMIVELEGRNLIARKYGKTPFERYELEVKWRPNSLKMRPAKRIKKRSPVNGGVGTNCP